MSTILLYSTLYLTSFLITIINVDASSVCLWGRWATLNREVNGLYRVGSETVNGRPTYKLDHTGQGCENKYLWLYFIDNLDYGYGIGWHLAFGNDGQIAFPGERGATVAVGTLAYCLSGTAATPAACNNGWYFEKPGTGEWYIDDNVTVTADRCPGLDCATITVENTGSSTNFGGCSSNDGSNIVPYDQIGANEYTLDKLFYSNRVWFFNIPTFQWICVNTDTHNVTQRCERWNDSVTDLVDGVLQFAEPQPWQDLSNGNSITITDVFSTLTQNGGCTSSSGGCTTTFTCAGTSTTTSFAPTTPNPTMPPNPTPRPTFRPITEAPTAAPTDVPTTPTVNGPSPTPQPVTQPTAPTVAAGSGGGDNGGILGNGPAGLDWLWWIIILIVACCCCILCLFLCGKLVQRKRAERANHVEMFGDQSGAGGGAGSYQPDPTYTVD